MQWPLSAERISSSPAGTPLGPTLEAGTLGTLALGSATGATVELRALFGAAGGALGGRGLVGVTVGMIARLCTSDARSSSRHRWRMPREGSQLFLAHREVLGLGVMEDQGRDRGLRLHHVLFRERDADLLGLDELEEL